MKAVQSQPRLVTKVKGNLGSGGVVEAAYAHAFVNDISVNELWSHTTSLGDLDMASFAEDYTEEGSEKWLPTSSGESTPTMNFDFEGKDNGGNVLSKEVNNGFGKSEF